jgi:hypothetical protein
MLVDELLHSVVNSVLGIHGGRWVLRSGMLGSACGDDREPGN